MAEKLTKILANGKEKIIAGKWLSQLVVLVFFVPFFVSSEILAKDLNITELENATISELVPQDELADMFNPMSDSTNFQRSTKLAELKGKVIAWNLPLYEISKIGDNEFRISTNTGKLSKMTEGHSPYVHCSIKLTTRDAADIGKLLEFKTGDMIRIKGVLTGTTDIGRALEIDPAILDRGKVASVTFMKCGAEEDSMTYFVGLDNTTNKERWFITNDDVCQQYSNKKNIGKTFKVKYFEEAVAEEGDGGFSVGEILDSIIVE